MPTIYENVIQFDRTIIAQLPASDAEKDNIFHVFGFRGKHVFKEDGTFERVYVKVAERSSRLAAERSRINEELASSPFDSEDPEARRKEWLEMIEAEKEIARETKLIVERVYGNLQASRDYGRRPSEAPSSNASAPTFEAPGE